MTPETRAQATYERIKHELTIVKHALGGTPEDVRWDIITHYLASAIRSAENEAIERCYRRVMTVALMSDGETTTDPHLVSGLTLAASLIRDCKHKDD